MKHLTWISCFIILFTRNVTFFLEICSLDFSWHASVKFIRITYKRLKFHNETGIPNLTASFPTNWYSLFEKDNCLIIHGRIFTLVSESNDGSYAEYNDMNTEQKQRLLDTTELIEETGKHLANGYRIAIETEEIGSKMLQNLHSQRETIQSSLNRVRSYCYVDLLKY